MGESGRNNRNGVKYAGNILCEILNKFHKNIISFFF